MAELDPYGGSEETRHEATGFFRLEQADGRWRFVDPDGGVFVSIGLNHADETNLKLPHNREIWKERYGSSKARWIRDGLVHDLRDWGFNTIGWTQEYISGDWGVALDWGIPIDLGHSQGWSSDEYGAANMPYCLQLRVAEIEDWNGYPSFRDVYSRDFDQYCEYLARRVCLENADSRNLLGYFLVDIPSWLPHANGDDFEPLRGLTGDTRDEKLFEVATQYYATITKHIRAHDPNHLILGDRYNGNKGIPAPVLEAMKPFVDVLSVQYFPGPTPEAREQMRQELGEWQRVAGKPVLIADIGNWCPTQLNPNRVNALQTQADRGADYVAAIESVLDEPWFVGWHWCAYVENTARGWGIKDPWDEPYGEFVRPVKDFNRNVYRRA